MDELGADLKKKKVVTEQAELQCELGARPEKKESDKEKLEQAELDAKLEKKEGDELQKADSEQADSQTV